MSHAATRCLLGVVTLGFLAIVAIGADDPGTLSIMALMHKQFTVSRAPFKVIGKEMAAESPDWVKMQGAAERFTALASILSKKPPRRGSSESWRRRVDQQIEDGRAMERAAKSRDLAALRAVHRRIGTSCKGCHDVHRFRPEN